MSTKGPFQVFVLPRTGSSMSNWQPFTRHPLFGFQGKPESPGPAQQIYSLANNIAEFVSEINLYVRFGAISAVPRK